MHHCFRAKVHPNGQLPEVAFSCLIPDKPEAICSESVKRIACPSGEDACSVVATRHGVDGTLAKFFQLHFL
jgi:hypothetical protein